MKKERKFEIDGKELLVFSTVEERYDAAKVKNIFDGISNQKANLDVAIQNATTKLNTLKDRKDLGKVREFMKMLAEAQKLSEYGKVEREIKEMKEQLATVTEQIEELRPWFEKMTGVTEKQMGVG